MLAMRAAEWTPKCWSPCTCEGCLSALSVLRFSRSCAGRASSVSRSTWGARGAWQGFQLGSKVQSSASMTLHSVWQTVHHYRKVTVLTKSLCARAQVLLSQVHRLRALVLLGRFLDTGRHKHNTVCACHAQVLLSQVHRLRALVLLGRFLDMGSWAVDLALSVGIFPYVLKLLQTTAADLRTTLVFIWTKILALDRSCQVRARRSKPYKYPAFKT